MAYIFLDTGGLAFTFPTIADVSVSFEPKKPARPKVTRSNYRQVASDFTVEQQRRLARLMARHDPNTCDDCNARKLIRSCGFELEAVQVVALNMEQTGFRQDSYPATDWNQNSYAAFGDVL